ncbi:MAG: amidohydrolase family protein [Betaproteobacteria bacterium]|nr:amidohydrolase family protein [Betaproteobacteria bacterium]
MLMPGLIDAHIHAYFYDMNVNRLERLPATMYAHHAANMLRDMLDRGFTTVRDTGGADYGLWLAIQKGLITAPRLYYCEKALSQTGGHADTRHHHDYHHHDEHVVMCGCCFANPLGVIVDGVDSVRRVIREQLRRGASFIKFMGSGGVASVSDPLEGIQFGNDEVRAIVEEVENHLVYCTAHIHPDRALKRAIGLGVHCIEHGTLIEADTANMAADKGVNIVPTLAVIAGLAERGEEFGHPRESLDKLEQIRTKRSSGSITEARRGEGWFRHRSDRRAAADAVDRVQPALTRVLELRDPEPGHRRERRDHPRQGPDRRDFGGRLCRYPGGRWQPAGEPSADGRRRRPHPRS